MLDDYMAILSAFGRIKSDDNYIYHYHSWEIMATTSVIAKATNSTRNTTSKRLQELEKFNFIEKVHSQRNVTLWKLKNHTNYEKMVTNIFSKLTNESKQNKEIKHLWDRQ